MEEKNESASPIEPETQLKKPRFRRILIWTSGIILLLLVIVVLFNFRALPGDGKPLVDVQPSTTYATEPLNANGDVDYVEYLNNQFFVPSERNVVVDLVRILGPNSNGENLPDEFFHLLQIPPPSKEAEYMVNIDSWLYDNYNREEILATVNDVGLARYQVVKIIWSTPYAKGQLPIVHEWFSENQTGINAIKEAVKKPDYFEPYVGDSVLVSMTSFGHEMSSIARTLHASAMGRLGNGDVDGAIDDQLTILRLGRHVGRHGVLVRLLKGMAIEGIGQDGLSRTIYSGKCNKAQLERLARELDSLPPPSRLGKQYWKAERAMGLEFVITIGREGPMPWDQSFTKFAFGDEEGTQPFNVIGRMSVDWEAALTEMNGFYDQFESFFDTDDFVQQAKAINDYEAAKALTLAGFDGFEWSRFLFSGRTGRGKLIAKYLGAIVLPPIEPVFLAGWRLAALDANTKISVALARYQLEHESYPSSLDQLVPKYLAEIPLDPFSGKLPIYDPQIGEPYLLYSVGQNRIDDGGVSMFNAPFSESDMLAVPEVRTFEQWIKIFEKENREREKYNREYDLEEDGGDESDNDASTSQEDSQSKDGSDEMDAPDAKKDSSK